MTRAAVEELMDRWQNDSAFRDELRTDPEGPIRCTGANLDPEEWKAVRSLDWSLPDEELQSRANKDGA